MIKNHSADLELLIQAQVGNEDKFMALFDCYSSLVKRLWQKFYIADLEFEDWDQEEDSKLFGYRYKAIQEEDVTYQKRASSYRHIIHSLNDHRIRSENVSIFSQLKELTKSMDCTKAQRICLEDAWDAAASIANESNDHAEKVYSKHQNDPIQIAKTNRLLISRSKRWLEKQ